MTWLVLIVLVGAVVFGLGVLDAYRNRYVLWCSFAAWVGCLMFIVATRPS